MTGHEWLRLSRPDGRELEVLLDGDAAGVPLLFQNGTPTAAAPWPRLGHLARERHMRVITFSRPGYAESSPLPGRTVADVVSDVAAVLDHLGAERFVALGWSGGGPHTLACSALLPERCRAAACIGSIAPHPAAGLEWMAAMGQGNIDEFSAVLEGEDAARSFLVKVAPELADIHPARIADALGDLVAPIDRDALTGEFAESLAEAARRAVSRGIEGWLEDDQAFVTPWGFELGAIARPVAIWQGEQDRMVPYAHGEWLVAHIPTAQPHLSTEDGHLSLGVSKLPLILDDLLRMADSAR